MWRATYQAPQLTCGTAHPDPVGAIISAPFLRAEKIVGGVIDVSRPIDVTSFDIVRIIEVPNRLYGVSVNKDGDAV